MNSESNSTPTPNTPSEHTISITMTQATELPDKLDQTLNAINTLNSKKQFDNWMEIVEAVFDQYEIANIIDRRLPHPPPTDAKYTIWRKASKQVRTWILSHPGND